MEEVILLAEDDEDLAGIYKEILELHGFDAVIASNGEEGNGDSYAPAISGDGKSVAFESYSSNLVESDKNGLRDIFVWNSETNQIKTVSIGAKGLEADAESYEPSVSGDGNLIAFTSNAGNISIISKGTSNNNVFLALV